MIRPVSRSRRRLPGAPSRWLRLTLALLAAATGSIAAQDWRALALASFDDAWQTIQDTFYDPAFGGVDWAGAGRQLRPRVESAASPEEARAVIGDLIGRLGQSHFALLSSASADALPGPASVPIDVRVIGRAAVISRVTARAGSLSGLAPGQELLAIGGQSVADVFRTAEGADQRAKNLEVWRRVNRALHGDDGTIAAIRVRKPDGVEESLYPMRSLGTGEVVTLGNLPPLRVEFDSRDLRTPAGRNIGVVGFSVWMTAVSEPFAEAIDRFRNYDGIIIDLRGNPGGLASMMGGIAGHFLAEPVVLGTMRTRQGELSFRANPRVVTGDGRRVPVFGGPVAILVDERTGSTSETFAGALQGLGRATVVGGPTMGQALPALTKRLPSGDVLIYAIGDFTPTGGRSLEGAGVKPDISISLSIPVLATGRDSVLDAALLWMDRSRMDDPGMDHLTMDDPDRRN